jgi:hypothetical protein
MQKKSENVLHNEGTNASFIHLLLKKAHQVFTENHTYEVMEISTYKEGYNIPTNHVLIHLQHIHSMKCIFNLRNNPFLNYK